MKKPAKKPNGQAVFDEIKRLDKQREALVQKTKTRLLGEIEVALYDLETVGFHYELVEKQNGSRLGTRTVKDAPCETCGFKTEPAHDGRMHRSQEPKASFTTEELEARGLKKV